MVLRHLNFNTDNFTLKTNKDQTVSTYILKIWKVFN